MPAPLRAAVQQPAGQLDASPTLFTVLAALNAAGYDAELQSPSNHPLRQQVRQAIAARRPPSVEKLKQFYAAHKAESPTQDLSRHISYALSIEGPPNFRPRVSPANMPPDTISLEGLSDLLAQFYSEAGIEELWRQSQPPLEELIARYHEPVTQAILDATLYLRFPTSGAGGQRFQIFLDVLGAPNQVHSRSFSGEYFVVVTSSAQLRTRDIRHAYLHYLLDPLAMRHAALLDSKRDVFDLAGGAPLLADEYKGDPALLAGMCMVKAVEARLDRAQGPALVEAAMKEGFILTAYFYEALQGYEKQEQAFRLVVPDLFKAIDPVKEDRRIAQVQFATQRAARTVQAPAPPKPALSPSAKLLESAESAYRERRYDQAAGMFRQVLDASSQKPERAKAYYGLARIAAQQGRPDQAQQLFEQTLANDPEPFERAWSHVYLGKLVLAMSDPDLPAARREFEAALAVAGASEGARQAAGAELQRLAGKSQ
jgi:tetratricopeptide (TPR) repeat protein